MQMASPRTQSTDEADDRIDPENIASADVADPDARYIRHLWRDHDRYGNIQHAILTDTDTDEYVVVSYRNDTVGNPSRPVKARFRLTADNLADVEFDGDHPDFAEWVEYEPAEVVEYVRHHIEEGGADDHIESIGYTDGEVALDIYDGVSDGPLYLTVRFDT